MSYQQGIEAPSAVERIAAFAAAARPEHLTPDIRRLFKRNILDSLGCAIAALSGPPFRALREQFEEYRAPGRCTLIGGGKTSADQAALFNSGLVRYVDLLDSYMSPGGLCHPSDNFGTVLAAAEQAGASGGEFMLALAVAYEIQCRFTAVVPVMAKGFNHAIQLAISAAGIYADWRKVHPIDFHGEFFKCRGPLNTVPSPQRRPTFVQAGGSPRGRAFAARHADSVIAPGRDIQGMKEYRDDVRAHAVKWGRNPDDLKVLWLVYPTLGETTRDAREAHRRLVTAPAFVEASLAASGTTSDIDFSRYDLDKPLPGRLTTNGEQGSLDRFQQWGSGKTLRQLAAERFDSELDLIGSPDDVSDTMAHAVEEIGGDGFLISTPFQRTSRRFITEVCEGLVPALQRRGLVREAYTRSTLRERLREF